MENIISDREEEELNTNQIIGKINNNELYFDELLKDINMKINSNKIDLFKVTVIYNKIYRKYYLISLWILILSSVSTFTEALRLIIIDYVNKEALAINENIVSMSINIICLFFGTIMTILSTIVRFRNYREILEQLREIQNKLIEYKAKYKELYTNLIYLKILPYATSNDEIDIIKSKIKEYDNDIKSINIIQYVSEEELVKLITKKAELDNKIKLIDIKKNINFHNNVKKYNYKFNKLNTFRKYFYLWNKNKLIHKNISSGGSSSSVSS